MLAHTFIAIIIQSTHTWLSGWCTVAIPHIWCVHSGARWLLQICPLLHYCVTSEPQSLETTYMYVHIVRTWYHIYPQVYSCADPVTIMYILPGPFCRKLLITLLCKNFHSLCWQYLVHSRKTACWLLFAFFLWNICNL